MRKIETANLTATTVTLGTFRKKTVLVTTTKHGVQRETPHMGLDNQRIRFNWGYHDGASSQRNGYKTTEEAALFVQHHFDRAYADGFVAGMRDEAASSQVASTISQAGVSKCEESPLKSF